VLGFVGLGQMGSLMAQRLTDWPGGLVVHDVRPEAMEQVAEEGAKPAASVEELARSADIISVMVVDDEQVRLVFDAILRGGRADTVVAVHSTIRPSTAVELERLGAAAGVKVLDAPVSGGVIGARAGRLALLVGGDRQAFEACRQPFELFAEVLFHFGPAGAGTRAKLARNLVNFVGIAGALEAARLAQAAGVDLARLSRVTTHSDSLSGGPGAVMLRGDTDPLSPEDPLLSIFAHTASLGEKDLALALQLGTELQLDLPLATAAYQHLAEYLGVPDAREGA
jgi:3-hydroxyisobutyrate dehydrogenase